jgi:chromosome segregation ATPase
MKVTQLFFLAIAIFASVAVSGEEGEVHHEEVHNAEVHADGTTAEVVDCDCSAQVAQAIVGTSNEKAGILAQLNTANEQLNNANEYISAKDAELSSKAHELEGAWGDRDSWKQAAADGQSEIEAAKQEAAVAKQMVAEAHSSAAEATAGTLSKIKSLEKELAEANAAHEDLSGNRIFINVKLIKEDIKGLLKSVGLVKA